MTLTRLCCVNQRLVCLNGKRLKINIYISLLLSRLWCFMEYANFLHFTELSMYTERKTLCFLWYKSYSNKKPNKQKKYLENVFSVHATASIVDKNLPKLCKICLPVDFWMINFGFGYFWRLRFFVCLNYERRSRKCRLFG